MAKFCGMIGYAISAEKKVDGESTGVWEDTIVERIYYGDITRMSSKWQSVNQVNDDLVISNAISIMADAFASQNFSAIKYVVWMGAKWKVINVEVQRPRLILTLGGVYNEQ